MALASSEFQNCTVPRTVTSSKGLWITWILSVLCECRCRKNSLSHDHEWKKTFIESFCSLVRFNILTKTAQEISIPEKGIFLHKWFSKILTKCPFVLLNDTGESNLSRMPNSNHQPFINLLPQKQEKKVFLKKKKLPLLTSILIYEKNFPLLRQQKLLYGATYNKLT